MFKNMALIPSIQGLKTILRRVLMRLFKAYVMLILTACLLVAVTPLCVSARLEARWALQSGDVLTGMDLSVQHPQATLYHNSATTLTDSESAGVAFPTAIDLSPSQGTELALPEISQVGDQSAETSDTGFFHANWCYLNTPNHGGGPIVASDPSLLCPFGSNKMVGSEYLFPYMTPIADTKVNFKPVIDSSDMAIPAHGINSSAPFTISTAAFLPDNQSTSIAGNLTGGQAANQSGPSVQSGARKPRINPASTAEQINGMTDLQRMYRNAFIGSTMYLASEGPVQSPTSISPNEHPQDVVKMKNHFQDNMDALNLTKPGTSLTPVFWQL